jgi:hypothetical protein
MSDENLKKQIAVREWFRIGCSPNGPQRRGTRREAAPILRRRELPPGSPVLDKSSQGGL